MEQHQPETAFTTPPHPLYITQQRQTLSQTNLNDIMDDNTLVPLDNLSPASIAILYSPSPIKLPIPTVLPRLHLRLWNARGKSPRAIQVALLLQPATPSCHQHGIRYFAWIVLKKDRHTNRYYLDKQTYQRLCSGLCMLCHKTASSLDEYTIQNKYNLYHKDDIPYTFRQDDHKVYIDFHMPHIDHISHIHSWTQPESARHVNNWNNILI